MQMLLTGLGISAFLFLFLIFWLGRKRDLTKYFYIFCAVGLILRIISSATVSGYSTDISCFTAWSQRVFTEGFSGFYSPDVFSDYPPGYLYILYVIAAISRLFGISTGSPVYMVLLKLPSVICDILCGILIYRFAEKDSRTGFIAGLCFVFNPMVWLNSCMWGQVDSVFTLFILLALIRLHRRSYIQSALLYALALLIKPQAVIVFPVYIFTIAHIISTDGGKGIKTALISSLCGAMLFFVLVLPFSKNGNPLWIFGLYGETLGSYEYATLNAPNLYGLFGGNGESLYNSFWGLSYGSWSTLFIIMICILSGLIYFKNIENAGIFKSAAFLVGGMYTLSAKMHERYFFPAIAFLLMTYVLDRKNMNLIICGLFTIAVYTASSAVLSLDFSGESPWISASDPMFAVMSLISVAAFVLMTVYFLKTGKPLKKPQISFPKPVIAMCIIYAAVAFFNLGDTAVPQNGYEVHGGEEIILDLGEEKEVYRLSVFNGIKPGEYGVKTEISSDGINFTESAGIENLEIYAWHTADINAFARFVKVTAETSSVINEIALFNGYGRILPYTCRFDGLNDEQHLAAFDISYKNGTYFDEIYHARTAWEYTHGITPYEWTHPPLGKLLISIGIQIFGMTPFGWRFIGTLLGIVMIWLMYLLAYEVFENEKAGIFAAFLMMFDFMHFTQTRIATIDTYAVFFIMLMFLFMCKYCKTDFSRDGTEKPLKNLLWCGIFFGLGVASKWTCIYAGAGLAVCFFIHFFMRYKNKADYPDFSKNAVRIILSCIVFFVIIPLLIYWVSYIPYAFIKDSPRDIFYIFRIQKGMFDYHADLDAEHFFSSYWYQWPIMYKPMWYFSKNITGTENVSSISAFGNPALWWVSLPATAAMLYFMIKERKFAVPGFIIIGYLAQYLPWVGVSRVVFIYHYFTSVPFIIMIVTYVAVKLKERMNPKNFRVLMSAYCTLTVLLFVMFYPAISGFEVPKAYMKNILMWFSTWYFGG